MNNEEILKIIEQAIKIGDPASIVLFNNEGMIIELNIKRPKVNVMTAMRVEKYEYRKKSQGNINS